MKLGQDDSWDRITGRRAEESPAAIRAKAEQARTGKIAVGVGLVIAAFLMALRGKGKRS